MKNTTLVAGLLVASLTVSATAAGHENKKLIQYGWGPPTPGYVAKHIRQMETRPFDGVAMILDRHSFNHVFYSRELDDEQTQAYLDDLAAIQWEKFTDNFLMMYCRSNMDWFSEEDWGPDGWVLRNVRLCRAGHIEGRPRRKKCQSARFAERGSFKPLMSSARGEVTPQDLNLEPAD